MTLMLKCGSSNNREINGGLFSFIAINRKLESRAIGTLFLLNCLLLTNH